MREHIIAEMEKIGDVAMVVVDTSAAYYEGDEVNSNTQQAAHGRMMRTLIALPGGPCVLVNCHPVKNAAADNLLPLGAGGFLNEIDGNLTCAIDNGAVDVHWQGKFRGPDFEPLTFEIVGDITHERLVNSKGRKIPTVIARHLSDVGKEEIKKTGEANAKLLLAEIEKNPNNSVAGYAEALGWRTPAKKPQKSKVYRLLKLLHGARWITKELDSYTVTEKGKKQLANGEANM
jgi:hypothetical protein